MVCIITCQSILVCVCACRTGALPRGQEAPAEAAAGVGQEAIPGVVPAATAEAAPAAAFGRDRLAVSTDPSHRRPAVASASGQISKAGQMDDVLALLQCMGFLHLAAALLPLLNPLSPMGCCHLSVPSHQALGPLDRWRQTLWRECSSRCLLPLLATRC